MGDTMSTNVISVECLSGELTITPEGEAWLEEERAWMPSNRPSVEWQKGCNVVKMRWSGECSGNAIYEGNLKRFFSFTRGTAEFVFYWEGGLGCEGYRVVDGKMTRHEVVMSLGEEV